MASTNPDFAPILGLGEGVVPSDHGSVIIMAACEDVSDQVELRPTLECYRDLPVTYNGLDYFRNCKNFILQEESSEVDCEEDFTVCVIGESYFRQGPEGIINVTDSMNIVVLRPTQDKDKIFGEDLFQSLGSMFGM